MAPTIKVWNWNNFRGGLSDNAYIWPAGSFQNGSINIDTESEPGWFKLAPAATNYITTTGIPTFIYNWNSVWDAHIYTFCDDKAAYSNTTLKWAYNSTQSTTIGIVYHARMGYVSWTAKLFLFSAAAIHKADIDLAWVSYSLQATESSTYKTSVIYDDIIYFTSGRTFYSYVPNTDVLTTIFTWDLDETFRGLTLFQDQFKLYSNVNDTNWRQYIINVWDTAATYITNWIGLPIQWASNVWWIDYVVTWVNTSRSDLYAVSGTQRKLVVWNNDWIRSRTFWSWALTYVSPIMSNNDDIFVTWYTYNNSNAGLFKYGKYYPWMNNVLTTPVWLTDNNITAIASNGIYIYMGTKTGSTYNVKVMAMSSPPSDFSYYYAASWDLISLVFDWGNPFTKKTLKRIVISYDCDASHPIPKGGSFALYWRSKSSQSWTQIGATQTKTDVSYVDITENTIYAAWFSTFTQMEFKITLTPATSGGNNYYTPLIRWMQVYYYDDVTV